MGMRSSNGKLKVFVTWRDSPPVVRSYVGDGELGQYACHEGASFRHYCCPLPLAAAICAICASAASTTAMPPIG
jgi:hypothetical protein